MTHHPQTTSIDRILEVVAEEGFSGMSEAIRVLLNEVMKIERSAFLGAAPYERAESRRGHANGFKPKTVATRVGKITLDVPQVRGAPDGETFYPPCLERGHGPVALAGSPSAKTIVTPDAEVKVQLL